MTEQEEAKNTIQTPSAFLAGDLGDGGGMTGLSANMEIDNTGTANTFGQQSQLLDTVTPDKQT